MYTIWTYTDYTYSETVVFAYYCLGESLQPSGQPFSGTIGTGGRVVRGGKRFWTTASGNATGWMLLAGAESAAYYCIPQHHPLVYLSLDPHVQNKIKSTLNFRWLLAITTSSYIMTGLSQKCFPQESGTAPWNMILVIVSHIPKEPRWGQR